MTTNSLGNQLNKIVYDARGILFRQSELAQLTYTAFDIAYRQYEAGAAETIEISFPVGMTAENEPISSPTEYTKQGLLTQYQFLAFRQLASNGIVHLVTIIEAMTEDLLRAIFMRYPHKIGSDKKVPLGVVLESASIEAIHAHACDALLNEMGYDSPEEFAKAIEKLTGVKLLECPAFHKYMELKATRDVYIHSRGLANKIYIRKAGQHARVPAGNYLPVDVRYFLGSFEQCVQLTEWWETQLHSIWDSSEYEARKNAPKGAPDGASPGPVDAVSEQLRQLASKLAKPKENEAKSEPSAQG